MTSRLPITDLTPPHIQRLKAYEPGKPIEEVARELGIEHADIIKLASNENALGPSPLAVAAAREALQAIHFYPDSDCFALRNAIAGRADCTVQEIMVGAGSNELIHLIVRAFCRPGIDEVVSHRFAFISYQLTAALHDVPFVASEVDESLGCDVDAMIAAITPNTRVVFLANPNNPTGAYVPQQQFERLLAAIPPHAVFVVDEAYHEFAMVQHDYPRSQRYRDACKGRLVTLRTFSKAYGLAGLQIGYALADADVVGFLERVRRPFNVSATAQAAALAALDDDKHVERSRELVADGIGYLSHRGAALGCTVYPSLGNFVLVDVNREAVPVHHALLARGVIVRPMTAWGLPKHVRISIGTRPQLERAMDVLAEVLR